MLLSVCQLYLRYPCCSSMNFDPSPVDKYNSVNSSNSGCNLKLSIVERFSRCLIKVKLPYCSSRDFSSPVDKNNSVNSSNRKGWLSVYERLPRFRTIIWTRKKYVANAMPEKQKYLNQRCGFWELVDYENISKPTKLLFVKWFQSCIQYLIGRWFFVCFEKCGIISLKWLLGRL